ncbi:MAG TPA: hypothetical protein VM284_06605 [Candidatus Limnocylindria bacterium]|nr:hypothetical protein [Candidatus Limnocylindria bacterium]
MVDAPRLPVARAYPVAPTLGTGPCGPARAEVEYRCAEAERLSQAAQIQVQRLRDAKRMLARVQAQRDTDARVRDRRLLSDAKENARRAYRETYMRATKSVANNDVQGAAGEWLREINRLNRQLELADRRAADVARQISELTAALPQIELAADAARISAEAAQVTCVESRRFLAACEEDAARQVRTTPRTGAPNVYAAGSAPAGPAAAARQPATVVTATGPAPISLLLRGDRQALLGLTLRLAEEMGVEAGRLQLLLLELRQAIAARALEDSALAFPAAHPFWSQFSAEGARQLVLSLARLGYTFDGRDGWRDGRAPGPRELAMALEHGGNDPRSLRRPAGQAAIDELWQGTTVLIEPWLAAAAPDLSLGRLIDVLGPRASRLGELWDVWGRLRPQLLGGAH